MSNANDGARTLMCGGRASGSPPTTTRPACRQSLRDVALTSAYLDYDKPVLVVLAETPWGTHYKLKAYPFDMRDQFRFVSDLTTRGKLALADAGARQVIVPAAAAEP